MHHSIMPLTTTISCCASSACHLPPRRVYGTYQRQLTVAAATDQIKARRPPSGIVRRCTGGRLRPAAQNGDGCSNGLRALIALRALFSTTDINSRAMETQSRSATLTGFDLNFFNFF